MKPYYEDDLVTLYHGDCLDLLPSVQGIDLVVTSPPYNLGAAPWARLGHWKPGDVVGGGAKWRGGADSSVGVVYAASDDNMPHQAYVEWQRAALTAMWDTLSDRGAIYYNHKPRVIGDRLWLPLELNPNLPLRQIVVWARAGGMNFSPVAYVPTHEWVMIFAKEGFRLSSKGASGAGDVWRIPQQSNPDHPAPFPVGLPALAIDTARPSLVLDPFAGSGTTLVAAKAANVRVIGVEKSERYCEVAANRLSQGVLDFGGAA